MICGNHATGLVFLNMTEGKMIQMIPEHPETPLLHLNGERGFVFSGGGKGVSFQPVAKTGDIRSLHQGLSCQGAKDCRRTASRSDINLKT
jgi:hypothetical protein